MTSNLRQWTRPQEWQDDILCQLFNKSISTDENISTQLTSLPQIEEQNHNSYSIDLGGKSVPSHDSIYGGWTECAPSLPQQPAKNVLLASSSTDDEKNNHHGSESTSQKIGVKRKQVRKKKRKGKREK